MESSNAVQFESSIESLLALLKDSQSEIISFALIQLNQAVDAFWPEIADSISFLEQLFEDETFSNKELVAMLISKVYYHLGEYDEAMQFMLEAGSSFDVKSNSEYISVMKSNTNIQFIPNMLYYFYLAQCIDRYIKERLAMHSPSPSPSQFQLDKSNLMSDIAPSPPSYKSSKLTDRLEHVMNDIFQQCFQDKQYRQVVGIALECERLDILEAAFQQSDNLPDLLDYVKTSALSLVTRIEFRDKLLKLLSKAYQSLHSWDLMSLCECWVYLNDPVSCSEALERLLTEPSSTDSLLMAYQAAFTLYGIAPQDFRKSIYTHLQTAGKGNPDAILQMVSILSGNKPTELALQFFYRNNHVDRYNLQTIKSHINAKSSLHHSALTTCHAILQCGTSNDDFLRNNMEFLSYANNWSKFSATASLGLIHKGQVKDSQTLLSAYLPKAGISSSSPYSEGGALFALGMIHANHGDSETLSYLSEQLKASQHEVLRHGAALGLGVAGLASKDPVHYDILKNALFADNAVAGEAAALSMGLIMLGSNDPEMIEELLQYAHDTQHEKIIRGIAIALALMVYGREDQADVLIEQMLSDKDPILRYGGAFAVALAYAGSGNNFMLKKLLHLAVSDTNDDVRRAAVMSVGFLCFRQPEQVPKLVKLLAESYNPYVRFGAAMALGLACAGSGGSTTASAAISLLEPLLADMVDFVRQGSMLAMSMILMQTSEAMEPKSTQIRSMLRKIVSDKREDAMTKFGAIIAQGLLDAAGRNALFCLSTPPSHLASGLRRISHPNMPSIVGAVLFCQYWYWFPMIHFIGLGLNPTHLTCLTVDMKIPSFSIMCTAKPIHLYAYPPDTKPPVQEKQERAATAVLSTTAKAKARSVKKDIDENEPVSTTNTRIEIASESRTTSNTEPLQKNKDDSAVASSNSSSAAISTNTNSSSPSCISVGNLSRVLPAQATSLRWSPLPTAETTSVDIGLRYEPILPGLLTTAGFLMLRDTQPDASISPKFIEPEVIEKEISSGLVKTLTSTTSEADKMADGSKEFLSGYPLGI